MKREEIKKWRESTVEELEQKIDETKGKLFKMRHQLHIGQLKNFSEIKKARRNIGVFNTLIGEKKNKNGSEKRKKG